MDGNEVLYDYIVVLDNFTKEVLACIPIKDGAKGFTKEDVELKFYGLGAEPVFKEYPCSEGCPTLITLNESMTLYKDILKS